MVSDVVRDSDGKSYTIKGHEKLKSRHSDTVIVQPFAHKIRFGPYGRILRLRADVDLKMATGNWKQFGTKNPYSEMSDAAFRSTRSLSISMKDFTVYNVIGKGGFGTVSAQVPSRLFLNANLICWVMCHLLGCECCQEERRTDLRAEDS